MSEVRSAVSCISVGADSVTTTDYVSKVRTPKHQLLIFGNYRRRPDYYEQFCTARVARWRNAILLLV